MVGRVVGQPASVGGSVAPYTCPGFLPMRCYRYKKLLRSGPTSSYHGRNIYETVNRDTAIKVAETSADAGAAFMLFISVRPTPWHVPLCSADARVVGSDASLLPTRVRGVAYVCDPPRVRCTRWPPEHPFTHM